MWRPAVHTLSPGTLLCSGIWPRKDQGLLGFQVSPLTPPIHSDALGAAQRDNMPPSQRRRDCWAEHPSPWPLRAPPSAVPQALEADAFLGCGRALAWASIQGTYIPTQLLTPYLLPPSASGVQRAPQGTLGGHRGGQSPALCPAGSSGCIPGQPGSWTGGAHQG